MVSKNSQKQLWAKRTSLFLLFTIGCDLPGKPRLEDQPGRADGVLQFESLFSSHCAGCHGNEGHMGPAPPLNDALFQALVPKTELLEVIKHGRSDTPMPAFARESGGPLTPKQVQVLADGITSHWRRESTVPDNAPPYQAVDAATGNPMSGNLAKGQLAYGRACAGCHGANGEGGKWGDMTIGPLRNSAFLELLSRKALRRLIITGRHDLGMPHFADKAGRPENFKPLGSEEVQDIIAFLDQWKKTERP